MRINGTTRYHLCLGFMSLVDYDNCKSPSEICATSYSDDGKVRMFVFSANKSSRADYGSI
jgi:hypothetical protein